MGLPPYTWYQFLSLNHAVRVLDSAFNFVSFFIQHKVQYTIYLHEKSTSTTCPFHFLCRSFPSFINDCNIFQTLYLVLACISILWNQDDYGLIVTSSWRTVRHIYIDLGWSPQPVGVIFQIVDIIIHCLINYDWWFFYPWSTVMVLSLLVGELFGDWCVVNRAPHAPPPR